MNARFSGGFSSAVTSENARGCVAVIPDIKCVSPKEGDLLRGRDPVETAKYLVSNGAPVLSVVTERDRFGGSAELLRAVAGAVDVPVLRKDFITSEAQLLETAELGATAVLLICATTDKNTLKMLYEKAMELGLEPVVEVHTAEEMAFAATLGAGLIGINNRNIMTFERDDGGADRTVALASGVPAGALLISESGILSPADARLAVSAGANAVLVGTALWLAGDMAAMYRSLRVERKSRVSACRDTASGFGSGSDHGPKESIPIAETSPSLSAVAVGESSSRTDSDSSDDDKLRPYQRRGFSCGRP
jgi:indole-3-glycerol phosphate synthase